MTFVDSQFLPHPLKSGGKDWLETAFLEAGHVRFAGSARSAICGDTDAGYLAGQVPLSIDKHSPSDGVCTVFGG